MKDLSELINVGYRDKMFFDHAILQIINMDNNQVIATIVKETLEKNISLLN